MGDRACPTCGVRYDPVSGYCEACEGELELWRVYALSDEWLAHTEENPPPHPEAVVSTRNVARQIERFLPGAAIVVAQRQD